MACFLLTAAIDAYDLRIRDNEADLLRDIIHWMSSQLQRDTNPIWIQLFQTIHVRLSLSIE